MRRSLVCAVAPLVALALAGPAQAAPKLTLSGPARLAAGAPGSFTVTVKADRAQIRRASLSLLLSTNAKRDARDRRLVTRSVKRVKARRRVTVKLPVTVPVTTAARSYRVLACLTVAKKVTCGSRALTVTARPAPPVSAPATPAPAPATPAPQPAAPSPDPTAVPTPAPTSVPPVVIDGHAPAPGPVDAPAPAPAPTALEPNETPSLQEATAFLYTGAGAVQQGVAADTIELERAAVLRGTVANRMGGGIGGVRVSVLDHPEYGRTATRADGGYELAVNGGGPLTLVFEREGWISAQRQVDVPWQDYAEVDPLVLVPYDVRGTRIDTSGAAYAAVRASTVSDAAGTRTQTLLFAPGTTAEMEVGGAYRPLGSAFTVRSTEFTQGERGQEAMPGELPASTAYTYAVELSVDEAVAAGATDVRFSRPVATYMENFLAFPVGTIVPTGWYDREQGRWVGAPNGRVVEVVAGGVDTDGDGLADNRGIGAAELPEIAKLYPVGTELWRTEVTHFTPWDHNHPYGPAPGAAPPGPTIGPALLGGPNATIGPSDGPSPGNPCPGQGSVILCDDQILSEYLPLTGTDSMLVYRSDRVPGRTAERTLDIRLRDGAIDATLEAIDLTVSVAGQVFKRSFTPAQSLATPVHQYVWDGLDGYGRRVNGTQTATITVGYRFKAVYQAPAEFESSWARVSGVPLTANSARDDFTLSKTATARVAAVDARPEGLGGWTFSDHHRYDPASRTLLRGDGGFSNPTVTRIGALRPAGSGLDGPTALATAADGSVLIADTRGQRIRRVALDGTTTVVAGTGAYGFRPGDDGGPATAARLSSPQGVAVDGDVVYVADTQANRVRRIDGAGRITTVAGGGTALGDGGPATAARLSGPTGVAVSSDGALYIADTNQHRVRMIGTDGSITTVAGDGTPGATGDGGPAAGARLRGPGALAVDAAGGLLIADAGNGRVRRIGVDGVIATFAGGGAALGDGGPATAALLSEPTGLATTRDGDVLIADAGAGRVRGVSPGGTIRTVGGGGSEPRAANSPVTAIALDAPTGVAVRGDQALVISEPARDSVSTVSEPLPGFTTGDVLIPSGDGAQVFQFDAAGRHLRTRDTLTGAVLRRFTYDAANRLTGIHSDETGAHAPLVTVERPDAATVVLRMRGGRTTTLGLDAGGWLDHVTNPAGDVHDLTHAVNGLLLGERDAEGGTHAFSYDPRGRLTRDEGPDGFVQTLALALTHTSRTVTKTTGGGQVTVYKMELAGDELIRTVVEPAGGTSVVRHRADGSLRATLADGTVFTQTVAPDPRWGLQAPYASRSSTTTPGGRTTVTTGTRTLTMRDAARVETLVDTETVDGKTTTRTFAARPGDAGGTVTQRSPTGRTVVEEYDSRGRRTSLRVGASAKPVTTVYDDAHDGRIASEAHGTRTVAYAYDARNRVTRVTPSGSPATEYGYDLADRLTSATREGRVWQYTYDRTGRRLTLRTPTGRTTQFGETAAGLSSTLTLPGLAPYTRGFTTDRLPAGQVLPSGARSTSAFDAPTGRLTGRADVDAGGTAKTATAFTYAGATGRPATETWSAGALTQQVATEYDGDLTTRHTFTGAAEGTIALTPAATGLRLASVAVTAGSGATRTYAITRNDDQLVTAFGPYTVDRDPVTGIARGFADAADGTDVRTLDTQGYGEIDERRVLDGADTRYALTVERDAAGRVSRRTETIAGGTETVRSYEYDGAERLVRVRDGAGSVVEAYDYDAEGDRTSATSEDHGSQTATYDATTDLQTAAGPTALDFGPDGFLRTRGGRAFEYGPSGELLRAETAAGTVTYAYDATGRLVGRARGAERTGFLYGNPDNHLQVTASVDEAGVLTTYFYDDHAMLHAFDRGGTRYRVGTDQVGTPRVIIAGDGSVAGRVDRDSFGRVLARAGGVRIPLGFAGGIEDADTGLVRFGLRDYDPETGRFTARDPSFYAGSPGNLYAYGDNRPADRRDPTGLWSVGVSAYLGIGGGVQFAFEDGGWSYCGEMGVGLGVAAEADPFADAAEAGDSTFGEAGGKAGFWGGSLGAEQSDCPPYGESPVKITGKVSGGPISVAVDSEGGFSDPSVSAGADAIELSAQGKAGKKRCIKMSTTWW